jgi:Alkylmercury lyase
MADRARIDQMFHRIQRALVETGRAPHYAELARSMALGVEEGRRLLLDVMEAYPIGWLHPETDYIASFPPLNNLPTQYRVTVGGEQKWFAQCGFEATSVTWLFPDRTVRLDAPCLDCGDPVRVEMRDGRIVAVDPPTVVGHLNYGFGPSRGRPPYL